MKLVSLLGSLWIMVLAACGDPQDLYDPPQAAWEDSGSYWSATIQEEKPVEERQERTNAPANSKTVVGCCGRPTKRGTPCKRHVRGGGPCWQHK